MRLTSLCGLVAATTLVTSSCFSQFSLKPAIQSAGAAHSPSTNVSPLADPQIRTEKKSVLIAIGYSLLIPGLGDMYADNFRTGRYYMGADAALWMTYGGFRVYGNWLKQDAKTYAAENAAVNLNSKNDQFAVDLGNFNNVYDYNDAKLRNRQFDLMYDPNSAFSWQWRSEDDRLHYKDMRIRGDAVLRNSQFVIGVLVMNRLIAAISAVRSVSAYNRSVQSLGAWRLKADVTGGVLSAQNMELTLSREF
jgi:hypothetical protein